MFYNISIKRIFRLGDEDLLDGEDKGYVKDEDSIMGYFGINNTLKAMSMGVINGEICEMMSRIGFKNVRSARKLSFEQAQC